MKMNALGWVTKILLIIGGLNWGLAIWDMNLVTTLFGTDLLANIVYGLVGLSAIWEIVVLFQK